MEHRLIRHEEYARSHSGKNYYARCSCGKWSGGGGGGLGNYPYKQEEGFARHVRESEDQESGKEPE